MNDGPSSDEPTVWTVGHSNHPLAAFLHLLTQHRIAAIVDVRSSPYCRYAVHFNKDALEGPVQAAGVKYLFLGHLLGGRAEADYFYDDQGRVCYDRLAQSAGFREGIEQLLRGLPACRTAIMCGEEDPTECHRRLLIGRVLRERGVRVLHLRGDGRQQTEDEVAAAEQFRKTKGQFSLFDTQETDPWKSTQSVLPKRPPPSSSRR